MKASLPLSFHKNNYLDPAIEVAETLALELTVPFKADERGDLEVTCYEATLQARDAFTRLIADRQTSMATH